MQTLIDRGTDPRTDRAEMKAETVAKQAEAQRKDATVNEAWTRYIEVRRSHWGDRYYADHVNLSRLGGEPSKRGNGKTTPGPLAPLMGLKLSEIMPERTRAWLQTEADARPTQTRQAFGVFRTFLAWCEDQKEYRGLAGADAFATRIARQELPKKGGKDDVVQREQLPAWFASVRQLGNPVIAAYLQTLLLTGARRKELATLTWENLDFNWSSMTIRDKVEGQRTIPLTPYVAFLLAALPRRNRWVFSKPNRRIRLPSRASHRS